MAVSENEKHYIPDYHEKIYEFDEDQIETKMKDFILRNPNMQCLVLINYRSVPPEHIDAFSSIFDKSVKCFIKHQTKCYHS